MRPSHNFRLQSNMVIGEEPALTLAADLFLPTQIPATSLLLVCLPGGGMNRRYFNLEAEGDAESYSFAAAMTAQGFLVATLDHPGVGDSSRPADGFALTPERLAEAASEAIAQLLAGLRSGTLVPGLAALPTLRSVGVGHSMGAMINILLQQRHAPHAGLALLGFSTRGLPEYLGPGVRQRVLEDRASLMAELPALAKKMFGEPYPVLKSNTGSRAIYASGNAEAAGAQAVRAAIVPLLPVPAYHSMLPGNVASEAAQIRVPLFFAVGENDMTGPAEDIAPAFSASPSKTLLVLPATGHNHFAFASRHLLFERLGHWLLNHLD